MRNFFSNKYLLTAVFLLAILTAYFSFGFYHLGKYVTTDEQFWIYTRIPQYWKAIIDQKFKKTYINDKPGVSLAIFSGIGLISENPSTHKINGERIFDAYNIERTEGLYKSFRLPIFLLNGLMILYLFWTIKKISNFWVAIWSAIFVGLSPILLGISRIVNPDAVLWSFSAAAIFSYFTLLKTNEKKFIFLTALFTGLSLLSKYAANILFIFFFSALLAHCLINFQKNRDFLLFIENQCRNLLWVLIGSMLVFSILMPAVFFRPNYLIEGTIGFSGIKPFVVPIIVLLSALFADAKFFGGKIIFKFFDFVFQRKRIILNTVFIFSLLLFSFTSLNWIFSEKLINLSHIPFDARTSDNFNQETSILEKAILETYPLIFTLTPLTLFLILLLWIKSIFSKNENRFTFYTFSTTLFILIFLSGSIFSNLLLTPRYMIMLFPLTGFLAANGLYFLFEKYSAKKCILLVLSGLVFIAGIFSLWKIKPFYYNYTSSLLPQKYTISNAWGFGGYQAAQYLNNIPNAENNVIWSDYRGVCEFSKSKCIIHRKFDKEQVKIDYYIITRRGQSRTKNVLLEKFEKMEIVPEWEFFINNRPNNFIKIFKNENDAQ